MSLLLFLKPHYRRRFGWLPAPSKSKKRKKKVFKVEVTEDEIVAKPVDYTDLATSLTNEVKVLRVKRRKKRANEIVALLNFILEEDE